MTQNPYARYVEGLDPLRTLEQTPARIEEMVSAWNPEEFERSYAPGKWTARQMLAHLAHTEIVFSNRLRFGLAVEGYLVQPFDQDAWMAAEPHVDGYAALAVYLALRHMNLALCRSLTPEQRTRTFSHPEYGPIDLTWVMTGVAGHELHHLMQFETMELDRSRT